MSCYLITMKDGRKVGRPVTTREEYMALRDSQHQRDLVAQIRRGNESAKHRLVQMNYSCVPNDDGTLRGAKRMTDTVGMDIDGLTVEQLDGVAAQILAKKEELHLLMLERSARLHGFHLAFKRRPELTQEENLRWASEVLGVEYDSGAKDITRVFYTTSGEDLLWLDEELFEEQTEREGREAETASARSESGETLGKASRPVQPRQAHPGCSEAVYRSGAAKQEDSGAASQEESSAALTPDGSLSPTPSTLSYPQEYQGIPYSLIVSSLCTLMGGNPEEGARNNHIFAMAAALRHVCNHDPDWIAKILPTYGEEKQKWWGAIKSACKKSISMTTPHIVERALSMAAMEQEEKRKKEDDDDDDEEEATDGSGNGTRPPRMPRRLPPLIKLLVSKTPKIYQPAVAHAVFPALATHLWKTYFRYTDNVLHEATLMNVLMAGTGAGKNCIAEPINHIMKDIRESDNISLGKEQGWKDEMNTKGSNKDKKKRPEGIIVQEVDADMTNAAFVMRLSEAEEHFLYVRMNEIEQFNALKAKASSDSHFQIMCLAFDPGNTYGQTRVGTQSVSKRVCIRFNWNASTTIKKGKKYFSKVLTDGPISRINFCTIPEQPIGADMPVYGTYDAVFDAELKPYIDRLKAARGVIECPQAFNLARQLKKEDAEFANLSNSRTYENLSFRANVIAYLKAMVLYVASGEEWDKTMENFIRWSERYDMWCKMHFFGEAITKANSDGDSTYGKRGPKNMLIELPSRFTIDDVVAVRRRLGYEAENVVNTKKMLRNWVSRGYVKVEGDVWVKN